MSSIASRRASYRLESERRTSVEGGLRQQKCTHKHVDEQQQPSPLPAKRIVDDGDNQEEESTSNVIRPASPVAYTPKNEENHRQKHATSNYEPPVSPARLRQENEKLKLQLVKLDNQHKIELQVLKRELAETVAAHQQADQLLKKQVDELEQQRLAAAQKAQAYLARLEILQKMLHELESKTKDSSSAPLAISGPPRLNEDQPQKTYVANRVVSHQGNGSPLSYGNRALAGSVKPFPWVQATPSMGAAPTTPRHILLRAQSFIPASADKFGSAPHAPKASSRYIQAPIEPLHTRDALPTFAPAFILPPPVCVTKGLQQREAALEKKPSGSLLSYCADMITAKLGAQPTVVTPKPNMKVLPAWHVDGDNASKQNPTTGSVCIPPPRSHAQLAPDDEYTAITIL